MGLGFTLALLSIAVIREVFGSGSFAGMEIPFLRDHTVDFLVKAPGGMLVYGVMIALVSWLTHGRAPRKKSFSCAGCASAAYCSGSCDGAGVKEEA